MRLAFSSSLFSKFVRLAILSFLLITYQTLMFPKINIFEKKDKLMPFFSSKGIKKGGFYSSFPANSIRYALINPSILPSITPFTSEV